MICNRRPNGWELVYQNAHGFVAMELLRRVRAAERPERWGDVLLAAAQHDNGWQEWEPGDHLTPLGTPRHFEETTMADVVRQSEMALGRVRHASLFSGLLLVEHFRTLYRSLDDAGVTAMLKRQRADAARWRRALGVRADDVARHYAFVRWADTLSLALTTRRLDPMPDRRVEIERIGDAPTYAWLRSADDTVGLDPWPYDTEAVDVSVETYHLPKLTFPSSDALAEALRGARIRCRTWTLRAGD